MEYRYLDIIKKEDNVEFDVDKEVNSSLFKDDIVQSRQYSSYDSARYDWSTGKISSRKITRIGNEKEIPAMTMPYQGPVKSRSIDSTKFPIYVRTTKAPRFNEFRGERIRFFDIAERRSEINYAFVS